MMPSNIRILGLIGASLFLSACSEHDDLRQWMSSVKQQAIKSYPQQEVPSVNAMATYTPPNFVGLQAFNSDRLKAGRQTGEDGPNMNRPKEILEASTTEIAEAFGKKDHTTVMHALSRVKDLLESDTSTRATVFEIKRRLDQNIT